MHIFKSVQNLLYFFTLNFSTISLPPTVGEQAQAPPSKYAFGLRNRLPVGGGCVYVLQMFFLHFSFFLSTKTMRQPFLGTAERIFMKLYFTQR